MLKHIVIIKLNSNYTKEESDWAKNEIINALKELPKKIEQIKSFQVSANELIRDGAADIILISEFENETDLNIYRMHQAHLDVVSIIAKHKEKSYYVDFYQ